MTRMIYLAASAALALSACSKSPDNSVVLADETASTPGNLTAMPDMQNGNSMLAETVSAGSVPAAADFVRLAAESDRFEIESGRLAARLAEDSALKRFGTEMVAAHMATSAAMQSALKTGGIAGTPPASPDPEHESQLSALKAVSGAQFDSLYKSQQLTAHNTALRLMTNYAKSGDNAALKQFAADTQPKVKRHLDMLSAM